MPALTNPRWERFAQCIVLGLGNEPYSNGRAYVAAGYKPQNRNSQVRPQAGC
jgi:hypothetical protein